MTRENRSTVLSRRRRVDTHVAMTVGDEQGKRLGRYIKTQDYTYDAVGRKVGAGDQLLRLERD